MPKFGRVAILLLSSAAILGAQNVFSSIVGSVTDPGDAALYGAKITATEVNTGLSRTAVADNRGEYLIAQLPLGTYDVTVEAPGFKQEARRGVVLQVDQKARLDFRLQLGATTETVEVTAQAPVVDTDSATAGQVINNRQVIELPLNGRDFSQLPLLAPSVIQAPSVGNTGSGISVAGARSTSNAFTIDGADMIDSGPTRLSLGPSIEVIQEFKIEQNGYSAEFGRYAGGQINLTTKSGTNQLHGGIFEFVRNTALDAKDYFYLPGSLVPELKRNQFGGSVGGPIKKDKTFIFGAYEGTRLDQDFVRLAAVPTAAMRAGDFSQLLQPGNPYIRSGATLQLKNPVTGASIPGNILSSGGLAIDPVAAKILALYPSSNLTGAQAAGAINYSGSQQLHVASDQYNVRVDHRFSSTSQLVGRYTVWRFTPFDPGQSPTSNPAQTGTNAVFLFNGFGVRNEQLNQNAVASHTWIISPSLLNELRASFNRIAPTFTLENPDTANAKDLGITGLDPASVNSCCKGAPSLSIGAFAALGYQAPVPQFRRQNTYQIYDSVSYTKGPHALKFGVDLLEFQQYFFSPGAGVRGSFTFNGQFSAGTSGFGLADLLLGYPSNTSRTVYTTPQIIAYFYQPSYSFYAQDDWKVSRSLTLNLGLRYDLFVPARVKGGEAAAFNPQLGVIQIPGNIQSRFDPANLTLPVKLPVPVQKYDGNSLCETQKSNFSPRVGFAYRPFHDNGTVIRGAYGVFYNVDLLGGLNSCGSTSLWAFGQSFPNPAAGSAPNKTLQNAFPDALATTSFSPIANVPSFHPNTYMQQWNFGIERALGASTVLEARYLGSKGTHLILLMNINQAPLGTAALNSRRPYAALGFTNTITYPDPIGNSSYHALNLRLERRAKSVTLLATYTLAKSLDVSSNSSGPAPMYIYDLSRDHGLSNFDARHRVTASFVYSLPFGRGHRFGSGWNTVLNGALGGWQTSGILTGQTGFALTPVLTGDISATGGNVDRPNLLADPLMPGAIAANAPCVAPAQVKTVLNWMNPCAFATPATGTLGNAARGSISGPGLINFDVSAQKYFSITERHRLEIRAEFFNALNHPNLGTPNVTANSATFGQITSTATAPRQIQLAARYSF
jgi:hypothetical protein